MEAPRSAGAQAFQDCAPAPDRNSYESQASASSSWYSSSDGDARLSAAGALAGMDRASAPLNEALDGLGGMSLDQVRAAPYPD